MKPAPFHPTFLRAAVGVLLAAAALASAGALVAERPGTDRPSAEQPSVAPSTAAPPTDAEHEAAVAWCRIRTLRQEIGLTSHDLAAMACTQGQAEAALSSLVSWYNTNRETLAARRAAT